MDSSEYAHAMAATRIRESPAAAERTQASRVRLFLWQEKKANGDGKSETGVGPCIYPTRVELSFEQFRELTRCSCRGQRGVEDNSLSIAQSTQSTTYGRNGNVGAKAAEGVPDKMPKGAAQ